MKITTIHLNEYYPLPRDPILEICVMSIMDVPERPLSKTIIIVPGGGYDFVSKREGDPIAVTFMSMGYITCKLLYSVDPVDHKIMYPYPQIELCAAMDYLKKHYQEYSIDPNKITAVGFSAGGHLVGSYSYKYPELGKLLNIEDIESLKPSAICLCYPVITFTKATHGGTRANNTGGNEAMYDELSVEKHVDGTYPPTFIWTTLEDDCVDPISTILMDESLTKANVYHQTILFPHGNHGLSLAKKLTAHDGKEYKDIATWPYKCDEFFETVWTKK